MQQSGHDDVHEEKGRPDGPVSQPLLVLALLLALEVLQRPVDGEDDADYVCNVQGKVAQVDQEQPCSEDT